MSGKENETESWPCFYCLSNLRYFHSCLNQWFVTPNKLKYCMFCMWGGINGSIAWLCASSPGSTLSRYHKYYIESFLIPQFRHKQRSRGVDPFSGLGGAQLTIQVLYESKYSWSVPVAYTNLLGDEPLLYHNETVNISQSSTNVSQNFRFTYFDISWI